MLISNNFNHINRYPSVTPRQRVGNHRVLGADTVSFGSSEKETIEYSLKRIPGLHDPYSEIVMVSDDEYEKYMRKVAKRPTAQTMLNLLHGYEKNLFTPEKEVCDILSDGLRDYKKSNLKDANKIDLHDLLNKYYLGAKVSLATSQLCVLENIQDIIEDTHGETKKNLTDIFEPVQERIFDDSFRISPLLQKVRSAKGIDKTTKKRILKEMDNFPNSRNSAEVFIVTNAHKTHEEIAEAFITPSRVSIEHIKPQSCSGKSVMSNYLIASKRMNSVRSSMPLDRFIKRNPNIPECMERYFNDFVEKINDGRLAYMAMSLPQVMETIDRESKGLVQLEIAEVSPELTKKSNILKAQLDELIQKFSK